MFTCQQDKVVALCYCKRTHLWLADYGFWISVEFCEFGLNVTEGPCHRQPSREHSVRAHDERMLLALVKYRDVWVAVSELCSIG